MNEHNFKPHVELIKVGLDLKGEIRETIELWQAGKEERQRHESMHDLTKFINTAKVYSHSDLTAIKD
jgi:preprotein translocase subunit SecD